MTHLFCLNELTAVRFVYFALRRRDMVLLPVLPLFPFAKRFLDKLARWAVARSNVGPIESLCPELTPAWELPHIMQENIFEEIEPWQRAYYRFDYVGERLADYAMAYKQVVSNYLGNRLYTMLMIRRAVEKSGREHVQVHGLSPDIAKAMEVYADSGAGDSILPFWVPDRVLNFFLTLASIVYALGWVLSRVRLSPSPAKEIFFAADYISDVDDINLYEEIEDGGPILLVTRAEALINSGQPERVARFEHCSISDGIFPAKDVPGVMWFVIKETVRLYSVIGDVSVSLYYNLSTLPFRRIVYRAFFNR
ncbi:MAG: hypothetical protein HN969_07075, partial [Verrucomicrobia bacterium]|nr:hypothetical protein [Verrucomicrobiota bacterium]